MSGLREVLEALADQYEREEAYACVNAGECVRCLSFQRVVIRIRAILAAHDDPPAPVGVERVEWGVRCCEGFLGGAADEADARWVVTSTQGTTAVRRTVTSYPDTVGEWVEVAGDE